MPSVADNLISILEDATLLLSSKYNDYSWSSWDNSSEALAEIEPLITALKNGEGIDTSSISVIFNATGPMQEVAISSGWVKPFMELAKRTDDALSTY